MIKSSCGNRDIQDRSQLYARFKFIIKLPKSRKQRIIAKRNKYGRIVASRPSDMTSFG